MNVQFVTFTKKRSYGAELEIIENGLSQAKIRDVIATVDKKREIRVTGWQGSPNNAYWHVKTDSSCGLEVASYVAKGYKDLINFGKVATALYDAGARVNEKCGLHVHVDVRDFPQTQVACLVADWMKIENVIANMLPEHRVNNKYCKMLSKHFTIEYLSPNPETFWQAVRPYNYGDNDRRVALNICNYARSLGSYHANKSTVELRLPEGTLDAFDVKNWIRLFVRFVDFHKKRAWPKNYDKVDVAEALEILGLHSDNFILSSGLRDTKDWFLRRILQHTRQKKLSKQAIDLLNFMWSPLRNFELSSSGEEYLEEIVA